MRRVSSDKTFCHRRERDLKERKIVWIWKTDVESLAGDEFGLSLHSSE